MPRAIREVGNQQAPLRLLYLEDYGTHGMFGDPAKTVSSHLYKALYILGSTSKDESRASQGGSFGFGKSAFIGSSDLRAAVVHTRFAPRPGDKAQQRLIGFTWWGEHEVGDKAFEGRAMFGLPGRSAQLGATPLVDDAAESLASGARYAKEIGTGRTTGIDGHDNRPRRRCRRGMCCGRTLLVAGTRRPSHGCDDRDRIGETLVRDRVLRSISSRSSGPTASRLASRSRNRRAMSASHRASGESDSQDEVRLAWTSSSTRSPGRAERQSPTLTPVEVIRGPLVALIRGPRMVIEYKTFQSRWPDQRGVRSESRDRRATSEMSNPRPQHLGQLRAAS